MAGRPLPTLTLPSAPDQPPTPGCLGCIPEPEKESQTVIGWRWTLTMSVVATSHRLRESLRPHSSIKSALLQSKSTEGAIELEASRQSKSPHSQHAKGRGHTEDDCFCKCPDKAKELRHIMTRTDREKRKLAMSSRHPQSEQRRAYLGHRQSSRGY